MENEHDKCYKELKKILLFCHLIPGKQKHPYAPVITLHPLIGNTKVNFDNTRQKSLFLRPKKSFDKRKYLLIPFV